MRQTREVFSWTTKSYFYDDSNKNQKNVAQKMAEWSSKHKVEKLKEEGKKIISAKPVHEKNSVRIEVKYCEA